MNVMRFWRRLVGLLVAVAVCGSCAVSEKGRSLETNAGTIIALLQDEASGPATTSHEIRHTIPGTVNEPRLPPVIKFIPTLETDRTEAPEQGVMMGMVLPEGGFEIRPSTRERELIRGSYRGRRFFGPFATGSELREIEIVYTPGVGLSWYHNGYFASLKGSDAPEQLAIYKRYYKAYGDDSFASVILPGLESSVLNQTPAMDSRATAVALEMSGIRYSSVLGGSIEMNFELAEDYEIEFSEASENDDWFSWDVQDLKLDIFVKPAASGFNPTNIWFGPTVVMTSLEANGVTMYMHICLQPSATGCQSWQTRLATSSEADEHQTVLESILAGEEILISKGMNTECTLPPNRGVSCNAARFAYAWMHVKQRTEAPLTHLVTDVLISEDEGILLTQLGTPIIVSYVGILDVKSDDDWFGDDEYKVTLDIEHGLAQWHDFAHVPDSWNFSYLGERFEDYEIQRWGFPIRRVTRKIDQGGSTGMHTVGMWTEQECINTEELVKKMDQELDFSNLTDSEQQELRTEAWYKKARSVTIEEVLFRFGARELDEIGFVIPFVEDDWLGVFDHRHKIPCTLAIQRIPNYEWGTIADDVVINNPLKGSGKYSYRVQTIITLTSRDVWKEPYNQINCKSRRDTRINRCMYSYEP